MGVNSSASTYRVEQGRGEEGEGMRRRERLDACCGLSDSEVSRLWSRYKNLRLGFILDDDDLVKLLGTSKGRHFCGERYDALQLLGCFALLSFMGEDDKLAFCFDLYDFEQRGTLSYDEMFLCFESTLAGFRRIVGGDGGIRKGFKSETMIDAMYMNHERISLRSLLRFAFSDSVELLRWIRSLDNIIIETPVPTSDTVISPLAPTLSLGTKETDRSFSAAASRIIPESMDKLQPEEEETGKIWTGAVDVKNFPPMGCTGWIDECKDGELILTCGSNIIKGNSCFWFHTSAVTSICLSDTLMASGEKRGGLVLLWDMRGNNIVDRLILPTSNGICGLHFAGKLLVALAEDGSLFLYNTKERMMEFATRFSVTWDEKRTGSKIMMEIADGSEVVICGCGSDVEFINIWRRKARMGLNRFQVREYSSICCMHYEGKDTIVMGDDCGNLFAWEGRKCLKRIKDAHGDMQIDALFSCSRGICSGGDDGLIKIWNVNLDLIATHRALEFSKCLDHRIASILWTRDGERLFVVTKGLEVFKLNGISGHGTGQALSTGHLGLSDSCIVGDRDRFVSAGADCTFREYESWSLKRTCSLPGPVISIGSHISKSGHVRYLLGLVYGAVILEKDSNQEWVQTFHATGFKGTCVGLSPKGNWFVAGSHVFNMKNGGIFHGTTMPGGTRVGFLKQNPEQVVVIGDVAFDLKVVAIYKRNIKRIQDKIAASKFVTTSNQVKADENCRLMVDSGCISFLQGATSTDRCPLILKDLEINSFNGALLDMFGFSGALAIHDWGSKSEFLFSMEEAIGKSIFFSKKVVHFDAGKSIAAGCDGELVLIWNTDFDLLHRVRVPGAIQTLLSPCQNFLLVNTEDSSFWLLDLGLDCQIVAGASFGKQPGDFTTLVAFLQSDTVINPYSLEFIKLESGRQIRRGRLRFESSNMGSSLQNKVEHENITETPPVVFTQFYRNWWGDNHGDVWSVNLDNHVLHRLESKVHESPIVAINVGVSADASGTIVVWSVQNRTPEKKYSLSGRCRQIQAVCRSGGVIVDGHHVFNFQTGESITGSHTRISGWCARATRTDEFATIGDDGRVCIWRGTSLYFHLQLDPVSRLTCCTYNKNDVLGIGTHDGKVFFLSVDTKEHELVLEIETSSKVNAIAFSPDDQRTAVACQDLNVYLLHNKKRTGVFRKHESPPTQVHFADDSEIVRSMAANASEVLFCDAVSANQIPEETLEKNWYSPQGATEFHFQPRDTTLIIFTKQQCPPQVPIADDSDQEPEDAGEELPLGKADMAKTKPKQNHKVPEGRTARHVFGHAVGIKKDFDASDRMIYAASKYLMGYDVDLAQQRVIMVVDDTILHLTVRGRVAAVATAETVYLVHTSVGTLLCKWDLPNVKCLDIDSNNKDEKICFLALVGPYNDLVFVDPGCRVLLRKRSQKSASLVSFLDPLSIFTVHTSGKIKFWALRGSQIVQDENRTIQMDNPVCAIHAPYLGDSKGNITNISTSKVFAAHHEAIADVHVNQRWMATCSIKGNVKAWNVASGFHCIFTYECPSPSKHVAIHSTGMIIITDEMELTVESNTVKEYNFNGHSGICTDICVNNDHRNAFSVATDGALALWDLQALTKLNVTHLEHMASFIALEPNAEQVIAVVCPENNSLLLMDTAHFDVLHQTVLPISPIEHIYFEDQHTLILPHHSSKTYYKLSRNIQHKISGPFPLEDHSHELCTPGIGLSDNVVVLF